MLELRIQKEVAVLIESFKNSHIKGQPIVMPDIFFEFYRR
jgi:hypothetical protein